MQSNRPYIPVILRGCEFIGIVDGERVQTLLFRSPNPNVVDGFIQVHVRFMAAPPKYDYSIWDPSTNTVTHYEGISGDPSHDHGEITSAP